MEWQEFIKQQKQQAYFKKLESFLQQQEKTNQIFPAKERIFACFDYFDLSQTKVVIIGQDPYYLPGLANGLAFAVNDDVDAPKSLINIFKELKDDLGINKTSTNLIDWAKQGVLLLNRVMSVNAFKPNSHQNQGWEHFTTNVVKLINDQCEHVVFILWGNNAKQLLPYINKDKHLVLTSSHPSPLGYYRSFKGSKPFSKTNDYLIKNHKKPINW